MERMKHSEDNSYASN